MNFYFQNWDYDIQLNWFKNSEQIGWLRDLSNILEEHSLPGFTNINLHISKQISLYQLKFKLNFSIFNMLSDNTKFNGLIIHDRRMYTSLEVKY